MLVQVSSRPTAIRGRILASRESPAPVPLGCLIKQPQPRVPIVFARRFAGRNHANRVACCEPFDLIAGMDMILFRNDARDRDLIFGRDFCHRRFTRPYYSKDHILVQGER